MEISRDTVWWTWMAWKCRAIVWEGAMVALRRGGGGRCAVWGVLSHGLPTAASLGLPRCDKSLCGYPACIFRPSAPLRLCLPPTPQCACLQVRGRGHHRCPSGAYTWCGQYPRGHAWRTPLPPRTLCTNGATVVAEGWLGLGLGDRVFPRHDAAHVTNFSPTHSHTLSRVFGCTPAEHHRRYDHDHEHLRGGARYVAGVRSLAKSPACVCAMRPAHDSPTLWPACHVD
jgi:hypothetical protein